MLNMVIDMKRLKLSLAIFVLLLLLPSNAFPIYGTKKSKTIEKPDKSSKQTGPTNYAYMKSDEQQNEVLKNTYDDSMFEFWQPKSKVADWSYNNPGAWASLAGSSCGGTHQSPIDIQPNLSVKKSFPKFTFNNYGNIDKIGVMNNGHTAVYSLPQNLPADRVPSITGGGLNDTYNFVQFHLHWGSDSTKGSEHLIRSRSYAAELHLVHYNTKYGSFADATKNSDGLAVLGIFLQVGWRDSKAFQPLVDQLGEVPAEGDETTLKNLVPFNDLLPSQTTSFYRYSGSLTTPKCNQIVTWTVFDHPIEVSEKQLNKFRGMKNDVDAPLVDNFRPAQPLNDRTLFYRSFTGCEIPPSWPITWTPLLDAIRWNDVT